jgi:hypothetical protein
VKPRELSLSKKKKRKRHQGALMILHEKSIYGNKREAHGRPKYSWLFAHEMRNCK